MAVFSLLALGFALIHLVSGQLSGTVGPSSSYATKAATKTCNVLDYGAVADGTTDIGAPIVAAWADCKTGGLVYIPAGTYAMSTWAELDDGQGTAIQLDGTIVRTGTDGGNMIAISNSDDFEFFSGTSKGAMQGYGYEYISQGEYGARFIRLTSVTNFSVHGFALVDSPSYYFVFDTCSNGEIYNLILRGISIGETDGIDIWGDNIWVHDVEVTNGDECVTVKSPASNILVESVYCNISGGCSIGSLGAGTSITDVYYYNIYANQADPAYLKTNGGTGTVTNVRWENVIVYEGAYILALNEYWGDDLGGTGVQLSNISFSNWHGTNIENSRPVIRLQCDDNVPCTDISLENINLWSSEGGPVTWECESAYGTGACLQSPASGGASYAATFTTISTAPDYTTATMPSDLASAFPSTASFTIPPVPTTFYPGLTPTSALLNIDGAGGLAKRAVETGVPFSA